jgi:cytochrome c biogenesis protein CcmG/thiol:disulfide interchange protein DsbE
MKFFKTHKFSILIVIVLILMKGPSILQNLQSEGKQLDPGTYPVIAPTTLGPTLSVPSDQRRILVFWATWCAPCTLELSRLKASVLSGKIPGSSIIAIDLFEDASIVRRHLQQHAYPFTFIEAPELVRSLDVQVTPTVIHLDQQKIISRSSGLSVTGIWAAENFIKTN